MCETTKKSLNTAKVVKEKKEKNRKFRSVGENSQKSYPVFVMPTKSEKMKKLKAAEEDKKAKVKDGYFQEKSDQDDTLEKVESLQIEMSDRTRKATKKKGKMNKL